MFFIWWNTADNLNIICWVFSVYCFMQFVRINPCFHAVTLTPWPFLQVTAGDVGQNKLAILHCRVYQLICLFLNLGHKLQQCQCITHLVNINCWYHMLWKVWVNGRFLIYGIVCIWSVRKYNFRSKGRTNEICPIFCLSPKEDGAFDTQGCNDHVSVILMVEYRKALQKQ